VTRGILLLAALAVLGAGCAKRQTVEPAVLSPDGKTARVADLDYGPDAFAVLAKDSDCGQVLRELAPPKRHAVKSGLGFLAAVASQPGAQGDAAAALAVGAVGGVIVGAVDALLPDPKGSFYKAVQAYNDCQKARAQRADTKR
jgi:hypothetical protein